MINRITIIKDLIKKHNLKTMLEIGTQTAATAKELASTSIHKTGVDIINSNNENYDVFYHGKSDNFFERNKEVFDITFIDGDHSHEQSLKDFNNALQVTTRFIVMHDCRPDNLEYTKPIWCGEVYKTAYMIIKSGFNYKLHSEDHGVLVIDMQNYTNQKVDTNNVTDYNSYINFLNTEKQAIIHDKLIVNELEKEVKKIKSKRKKNAK
jgi:hypothetical protein